MQTIGIILCSLMFIALAMGLQPLWTWALPILKRHISALGTIGLIELMLGTYVAAAGLIYKEPLMLYFGGLAMFTGFVCVIYERREQIRVDVLNNDKSER